MVFIFFHNIEEYFCSQNDDVRKDLDVVLHSLGDAEVMSMRFYVRRTDRQRDDIPHRRMSRGANPRPVRDTALQEKQ